MFEGRQQQDILRVVLTTGESHTGSYLTQAGMHFLAVRDDTVLGKVVGPFDAESIASVEVVRTRDEVVAEINDRKTGDRLPGRAPVTRDDYEYRLERLARAVAEAEGRRRDQLLCQFDETADRIALSAAKRCWLLSAAKWGLKSNRPPELADLWFSDVASPSLIRRPSPKDFDPDPAIRRTRDRLPPETVADRMSVPNMLARLRAAGLKASISLAGDPPWERAVIQVDLAPGRTGRFLLDGRRDDGTMSWQLKWGGNDSRPGLRNRRRARSLPQYGILVGIARDAATSEASPAPSAGVPRPGS